MTLCSRGPSFGHIEEPGTGRCFVCGSKVGRARPIAKKRGVEYDDWADPAGFDLEADDDPADAEYLIRRHWDRPERRR